ncbi:hypothetical protein V8D89_000632 [Ganoderma adspersum]
MSSTIPRFLAHFHIPVCTSLRITSNFRLDGDAGGSPETMKTVSTLLPPNRSKTLPILSMATRIVTMFMHDQWRAIVYHQYPGSAAETLEPEWMQDFSHTVFTLYSNSDVWLDQGSWTAQGLGGLVECFGRSPLILLERYEDHSCTSVAGWERVFRTFSLLEELVVHSIPGVELSKVFLGLDAASSGAHEDSSVACLNLRDVSVRGWGTVVTFKAMWECFQRRADRGARPEVLDLRSLYNGNDVTPEERCGFVEDLRQVVCVEDSWLDEEQLEECDSGKR